ncbi:hypothetical protein [Bacillus gobiensis]|uniref:Uncharacterized protein n=1 Tax=Bacillus gobiensis TaxID=1441095 RepID=A0A0M4G6E9_9BACI|nr:hypothetical protein [Bacillus gobiensis]ALC80428.1 hypothetical protein AM592_01635 [Bacillus gobiensis]
MKYFEVLDPYYALLKAKDREDAKLQYNATVADLEDIEEIKEVPEDYALVRFSQAPGENKKLVPPSEILKDFRDPKHSLLIIDGSLL